MTLIMMSGSQAATLDQVRAVPVPAHTRSHRPMPYGDIIDYTKDLIARHLRTPVVREQYALNKEGNQFFGEMALDIGEKDFLSIGLRSSYNKTVAAGMVAGMHLMVCDNLQFQGSAMRLIRKNTTNAWRDFERMADGHVQNSLMHFQEMAERNELMKQVEVNPRKGYALLGIAQGEGVLTSQQASVAFSDWSNTVKGTPRHEEFAEQNLFNLYQCVTEGLKKGTQVARMERQTKAHDFFEGWL
jgi:hypothetical protein